MRCSCRSFTTNIQRSTIMLSALVECNTQTGDKTAGSQVRLQNTQVNIKTWTGKIFALEVLSLLSRWKQQLERHRQLSHRALRMR